MSLDKYRCARTSSLCHRVQIPSPFPHLQGHIQPGSGHRRLLVAGSRKNPLEQIKEMLVYFCYITSTPHGEGAVTMHVPNGPVMAAVVPAIRFGWEAGRRKKGQCRFI